MTDHKMVMMMIIEMLRLLEGIKAYGEINVLLEVAATKGQTMKWNSRFSISHVPDIILHPPDSATILERRQRAHILQIFAHSELLTRK